MKNETLKNLLIPAMVWLQDPDSSRLAQGGKEAIKSFTVSFIISVFTIKRAVIGLGLFYLCLFISFHCLCKSHSHFVLLGFCPFQLLTDEWGRKKRLINKLCRKGAKTEFISWSLLLPMRNRSIPIFFSYLYCAFDRIGMLEQTHASLPCCPDAEISNRNWCKHHCGIE